VWKFNNSLLREAEFKNEMKNFLPQWIQEAERDLPEKPSSQWGFIKHKIGEFSRNFGAKLKKARSLLKNSIEKDLKELANNLDRVKNYVPKFETTIG